MRRQRGLVGLMGLAALVGLAVVTKPATAKVTTEQSASILIFPKVVADGNRDTVIQITNTSNNMVHAHCFYVNGALTFPALPPGPNNPPLWTETDFDIWLTKQQPTHWVVSTGRLDNGFDQTCRKTYCDSDSTGTDHADCCDAGYDPGHVPPVAPDFTGELKCIQVDANGSPYGGNNLKGEATLVEPSTNDTNDMNSTLCLGDNGDATICSMGAEYEKCPATWILDTPAVGAPDSVVDEQSFCDLGDGPCSSVSTTLTVVPCSENFETQQPQLITLQFSITNEFEQTFSGSTSFRCWSSINLGDVANGIFNASSVGGYLLQTRMRSAAGTPGGVVAVLEDTHVMCPPGGGCASDVPTLVARSAQNADTTFQDTAGADLIIMPSDQINPPSNP
jgi:hypothetical protein